MRSVSLRTFLRSPIDSIKHSNGETLAETLISTLIVSAVVLMLATAVVTAARVNAAIETKDVVFDSDPSHSNVITDTGGTLDVSVQLNGVAQDGDGSFRGYYTDNGYVYYAYER